MSVTPGQAVYEAQHAAMRRRFGGIAEIRWDELSGEAQAEWEDIARTGIAAYIEANGRDPVDARSVIAGALAPHPAGIARRLAEGLPGSPGSPDLAVPRGRSSRATALTVNGEPVPRTSGNAAMVSPETGAVMDELARVQRAAGTLGMVVERLARDLYAMWVDVSRGDLEAVRERVLNSIPDCDDNEAAEQWNGTETGDEWFDRTREGAR